MSAISRHIREDNTRGHITICPERKHPPKYRDIEVPPEALAGKHEYLKLSAIFLKYPHFETLRRITILRKKYLVRDLTQYLRTPSSR
jgi:hypothetical protein